MKFKVVELKLDNFSGIIGFKMSVSVIMNVSSPEEFGVALSLWCTPSERGPECKNLRFGGLSGYKRVWRRKGGEKEVLG